MAKKSKFPLGNSKLLFTEMQIPLVNKESFVIYRAVKLHGDILATSEKKVHVPRKKRDQKITGFKLRSRVLNRWKEGHGSELEGEKEKRRPQKEGDVNWGPGRSPGKNCQKVH